MDNHKEVELGAKFKEGPRLAQELVKIHQSM